MTMKQGLLWFDNDAKGSLEEKIARAAERYHQKFGHQPDTCYVNPQMVSSQDIVTAKGERVVAAKNVLPHHFWLGVALSDHSAIPPRAT
jgi:hypothetical protein